MILGVLAVDRVEKWLYLVISLRNSVEFFYADDNQYEIVTVNEARDTQGLSPVPWGDKSRPPR